jgi:hypothetical protein
MRNTLGVRMLTRDARNACCGVFVQRACSYYRRAAARFLLGKHADALRDYRLVRAAVVCARHA